MSDNFALNLLSNLYLNNKLSDVHFVVNEEVIPAHKAILVASCECFETLCLPLNENITKIELDLSVVNATSHHLKIILKYIYTGIVDIDSANIDDVIALYSLIHLLKFSPMENIALTKLCQTEITIETVGRLYEVANRTNSNDVLQKCLSFLDTNIDEVLTNKEEFVKFPFHLIREISHRSTFEAPEIEIFKLILCWKEKNDCYDLSDILNNIRLNLITAEDFATIVLETKLISTEDYMNSFNGVKIERKYRKNENDDAHVLDVASGKYSETSSNSTLTNDYRSTKDSILQDVVRDQFIQITSKMFDATFDSMIEEKGSISETLFYEMVRIKDLIINILTEESIESIDNLRNSITTPKMRQIAAPLGAIEVIMQFILQMSKKKRMDEVMKKFWTLLASVTEDSPLNCKHLLSDDVLQCFDNCLILFKCNESLTMEVLRVIRNLSDCDDLKHRIMRTKIVEVCLMFVPGRNITLDYLCRHILAQFCATGKDVWKKYLPITRRSAALIRLLPPARDLQSSPLPDVIYSNFEKLFQIINQNESGSEPKHWAIWTMAHLTYHDPRNYCSLIHNLEPVYPRNFICFPETEKLCSILLQNVTDWKKINSCLQLK